jgi:hypothetical protein
VVVDIAKQILAEPESADPTGGAVLYHAISMKQPPPWARPRVEVRVNSDGKTTKIVLPTGDFVTSSIKYIGGHRFGRSHYRGSDVPQS